MLLRYINLFIATSLKQTYCWLQTQSREIENSQSPFTWHSMAGDFNVYKHSSLWMRQLQEWSIQLNTNAYSQMSDRGCLQTQEAIQATFALIHRNISAYKYMYYVCIHAYL